MNHQSDHRHDVSLACRAASGDEKAWRELYEATSQQLYNLLCYQVGDRDVAKDLLQETFVSALPNLERYRGEGPLLSWLRTIALRKSLDWKRRVWRRIKQMKRLAFETDHPIYDPGDASIDIQSKLFRQALATLSAKQRAALLLREMEELSFREIAEVLECSEATCRVHHYRARENMRKLLTRSGDQALADEMGGQQI
ncbi:MAG: RNA polymerase sigma factor [bacterium]